MGALLVYFVVGSIVAVPFLGYQLLRTQRDLNQLRAELRRRGVLGAPPTVSAELEAASARESLPATPGRAPATLAPAALSAPSGRVDESAAARAVEEHT